VDDFPDWAGDLVQGVSEAETSALSRRERGKNRPMWIEFQTYFSMGGVVKDHPLAVPANLAGLQAGFQVAVATLFGGGMQVTY
jgi:hypothetical protein